MSCTRTFPADIRQNALVKMYYAMQTDIFTSCDMLHNITVNQHDNHKCHAI